MSDALPLSYLARHAETAWTIFSSAHGTAFVIDGIVEPMELGHRPYRDATFEHYVGLRGLRANGFHELESLPPRCRAGDNAGAFVGGFRLWDVTDDGRGKAR